jgi:flagellar biosynthesis/type III secretory pathway chaperone
MTATPRAEQLAAYLADEARIYADLIELGERERDAVVASDPARLGEIVAEKERLLAAVGRAEMARQDWIAIWARTAGVDPASVTLPSLLRTLPSVEAAAIAPLRALLLQRIRDVARMNYENGELTQGALRLVNGRLDAFARVRREFGYQPSGQRAVGGQTAVLDYRA